MLLVDETYRDLTHGSPLPMAATLSPRAISVSSMSKAYGLPGLRVGWAVCRDPAARRDVARGQGADVHLRRDARRGDRGAGCSPIASAILAPILDDVRARLAIVRAWMRDQDTFEWIEPAGGVVGLVRFAPRRRGRHRPLLRRAARASTARTSGPGHWFEVDDRHFRLGFGWPTEAELRAGLAALTRRGRLTSDPARLNRRTAAPYS